MKDTILYFSGNWDDDCDIMESILENVDFVSGTARRQMYKKKAGTGGSMLFGMPWRGFMSS